MLVKSVLLIVVFWTIYSIIPTIYYKYVYREKYEPSVLKLTFDDGPHPIYTQEILNILQKNDTKACFFVVGEKVEKYPDVLIKAYEARHEIGLHCYHHTHPIFWGIFKTRNDMIRAREVLNQYGLVPRYYRPPHGWVNLSMIIISKRWNLPIKLWTSIVGDWREDKDWKSIYYAMCLEKSKGGVMCLHDSNHKLNSLSKAPENTINALREYFKK